MKQISPEMAQRYQDALAEHNARVYSKTVSEDLFLTRWWMELQTSGEIANLMHQDKRQLAQYLLAWQDMILVYAVDTAGDIYFASWFCDPSPDGRTIFHGNWVRKDMRGTRKQLTLTRLTYQFAFEFVDNILGTTWQEKLLTVHQKLGYVIVGAIPGLFGHAVVYYVHLTKERFKNSRIMQIQMR